MSGVFKYTEGSEPKKNSENEDTKQPSPARSGTNTYSKELEGKDAGTESSPSFSSSFSSDD